MMQKRWSFGLSTIFSLIVIYFIYLYSGEKGWTLLAFLSKWYLIIMGVLIGLPLLIILLILLFALIMFLIMALRLRLFRNTGKKHKANEKFIDAEYKIKE